MELKNLDKAMEIVGKLIASEEISENGANSALYQEYSNNPEVYDIVLASLKKMNLNVYEYANSLFVSPGENNKTFGYTNEELRRELGVKYNKDLYLAYFVMYNVLTEFYSNSKQYSYTDFIRIEDAINAVNVALSGVLDRESGIVLDEIEENSFKQIALSWDELPATGSGELADQRAAKNSKAGFVKLVFNFMVAQDLLSEGEGRYFPTNRLKALMENYFEDYRGRLASLLSEKKEESDDATD